MSDDSQRPQPRSEASNPDGSLELHDIEQLLAEIGEGDLTDDLTLPRPPTGVWAAISGQLATAANTPPQDDRAVPDATVHIGDLDSARSTRARRLVPVNRWVALSAAASVVAVVAVSFAVARNNGDGDAVGSGPIVSTAVLAHDPARIDPRGADASATAELIERDGTYSIQLVDVVLPPVGDDDLELWLIQPDADGNPADIAPVGLVDGPGPFALPAGLDPTSHFVVDISIEREMAMHRTAAPRSSAAPSPDARELVRAASSVHLSPEIAA